MVGFAGVEPARAKKKTSDRLHTNKNNTIKTDYGKNELVLSSSPMHRLHQKPKVWGALLPKMTIT